MRISVIIPVLNEETAIAATIAALRRLEPDETIVVDGGSTDGTGEVCASLGIPVLSAPRGCGAQMNEGAARARGDVLLFLHADTRLPQTAFDDIRRAMQNPACVGGRFDLELDGDHWMLTVIGTMISYRSRLTKVGTGDQAIFVRRDVFERIGGFPVIPLMEDIAFCRALKRQGHIACLSTKVITSARRWEAEGVWRTVAKMWILKLLYFAGMSPARLKQYYADTR